MRDGIVHWEAFDDRHPTLSFTFQDQNLKTESGLYRYQRAKALPSGDLPGICKLSFWDLTESLEPPLPPWAEPDPEDNEYGGFHCCTDPPLDQTHKESLAKLATQHGTVLEFVRKPKKKKLQ